MMELSLDHILSLSTEENSQRERHFPGNRPSTSGDFQKHRCMGESPIFLSRITNSCKMLRRTALKTSVYFTCWLNQALPRSFFQTQNGSGWAISRTLRVYADIAEFQPLSASSFIDLPAHLTNKKRYFYSQHVCLWNECTSEYHDNLRFSCCMLFSHVAAPLLSSFWIESCKACAVKNWTFERVYIVQ